MENQKGKKWKEIARRGFGFFVGVREVLRNNLGTKPLYEGKGRKGKINAKKMLPGLCVFFHSI